MGLFHIAIRTELRQGQEFTFSDAACEGTLLNSLENAFGSQSILTRDNAPANVDLEQIGVSATNDHPSIVGTSMRKRLFRASRDHLSRTNFWATASRQSEPPAGPRTRCRKPSPSRRPELLDRAAHRGIARACLRNLSGHQTCRIGCVKNTLARDCDSINVSQRTLLVARSVAGRSYFGRLRKILLAASQFFAFLHMG